MKTETLLIATANPGKVKEFSEWFRPLGKDIHSLRDYNDIPEIVEDGDTFEENALKKAKTIAEHFRIPVLADDSGLCVSLLNGAPGVHSARYAGETATDRMNMDKLWDECRDKKEEGSDSHEFVQIDGQMMEILSPAEFVCALVMYDPASGLSTAAEGGTQGYILSEARGDNGFGYDPLFFVPQYGKTMAQLTMEQKNKISHRGRALQMLSEKLALLKSEPS